MGNNLARNVLVAFFILGWTYYMVSTILMKGSIFNGLRAYISERADEGSRIFQFLRAMLGCLMCTATETALWTLGVSTFAIGFHYRLVSRMVEAFAGNPVTLNAGVELLLAAACAFALSLGVAGEAWVIKTVFEFREQKFHELEEQFRLREEGLLRQISVLEHPQTSTTYEIDLT